MDLLEVEQVLAAHPAVAAAAAFLVQTAATGMHGSNISALFVWTWLVCIPLSSFIILLVVQPTRDPGGFLMLFQCFQSKICFFKTQQKLKLTRVDKMCKLALMGWCSQWT